MATGREPVNAYKVIRARGMQPKPASHLGVSVASGPAADLGSQRHGMASFRSAICAAAPRNHPS